MVLQEITWQNGQKNVAKKRPPNIEDVVLDCTVMAAIEYGYHAAEAGRKLLDAINDYEALRKQPPVANGIKRLRRAYKRFLDSNKLERLKKEADLKLNSSDETKEAITSSKSPSAPGGREKVSA